MRAALTFAVVVLIACGGSTSSKPRPIQRRPTFPNAGGGPVMVIGHVRDPGTVPWFRGMGITFAIRARGGALPSVDPIILIRRNELGEERTVRAAYRSDTEPEFELAPGDVVVVNPIIDPPEELEQAEIDDLR